MRDSDQSPENRLDVLTSREINAKEIPEKQRFMPQNIHDSIIYNNGKQPQMPQKYENIYYIYRIDNFKIIKFYAQRTVNAVGKCSC